jgi:hypothetical protein
VMLVFALELHLLGAASPFVRCARREEHK